MKINSSIKGLTLVEMMIVVAIVGIIAAVAYPTYQSNVRGSYRSTAQADLMALGAAMERHYNSGFSYKGAAAGGSDTGNPGVFAAHSPSSEPTGNRKYNLTIHSVSANGSSYELRATPIGKQAEDGLLSYFSDGRKGWDKNASGSIDAGEFCWSC